MSKTRKGEAVPLDLQKVESLLNSHFQWLSHHSIKKATAWKKRSKHEWLACVAEAFVRESMQPMVDAIFPSDDVSHGGIDFLCENGGSAFLIEVTTINNEKMTLKSGLVEDDQPLGTINLKSMSKTFLDTRRGKQQRAKQQLANATAPLLLAIVSTHEKAASSHFGRNGASELLVPNSTLSWEIPQSIKQQLNYHPTATTSYSWNRSFFLKEANGDIVPACPEISGVMLCAMPFRYVDRGIPMIDIALNPMAVSEFDPMWLPRIPIWTLPLDWRNRSPSQWFIENINEDRLLLTL